MAARSDERAPAQSRAPLAAAAAACLLAAALLTAGCGGQQAQQSAPEAAASTATTTAAPAAAAGEKKESKLASHILTDAMVEDFIANNPDGALLNFHSLGCGHCKALAPEFEAAAKELKGKDGAPLAFVDISVAPKAAEQYNIFRFPTLLWFRGGEMVLEVPPTARKQDKLVEYVEWASQPPIVTFESREELVSSLPELRAVLGETSPPLVCGFGARQGLYEALERTAEKLRGKTLFLFTEEALAGDAALQAFFPDAVNDQEFMGKMDHEAVLTWSKGLVAKAKAKAKKAAAA